MKYILPLAFVLLLPVMGHAGDYPDICMEAEALSKSDGDASRALALYDQCLTQALTDDQKGQIYYNVGVLHQSLRRDAEAVASYARAAEMNPADYMAYNNMAWIFASSPDPGVVNGEKAVTYALKACAIASNVGTLDTQAAALARSGKYREAAELQHVVVADAREMAGLPEQFLRELQDRLALYQNDTPYTETVKSAVFE